MFLPPTFFIIGVAYIKAYRQLDVQQEGGELVRNRLYLIISFILIVSFILIACSGSKKADSPAFNVEEGLSEGFDSETEYDELQDNKSQDEGLQDKEVQDDEAQEDQVQDSEAQNDDDQDNITQNASDQDNIAQDAGNQDNIAQDAGLQDKEAQGSGQISTDNIIPATDTNVHKDDTEDDKTDDIDNVNVPEEIDDFDDTAQNNKDDLQSDSPKESKADNKPKSKKIIAIDAGHQKKGNYKEEAIGPGATTTKPKVSSGTQGVSTKVPEYELTLEISLKVKEELIKRGYEVYMIRETHDVNLSNRERAELANESGADIFIRIHADSIDNPNVKGTSTLYPSKKNPYVSYLGENSYSLSKALVDSICDATGSKNRGAIARDDMSGINWCTIPVSIIEMGYMSNKEEDELMQTEDYQDKIVQGICDGIDLYYKQ